LAKCCCKRANSVIRRQARTALTKIPHFRLLGLGHFLTRFNRMMEIYSLETWTTKVAYVLSGQIKDVDNMDEFLSSVGYDYADIQVYGEYCSCKDMYYDFQKPISYLHIMESTDLFMKDNSFRRVEEIDMTEYEGIVYFLALDGNGQVTMYGYEGPEQFFKM